MKCKDFKKRKNNFIGFADFIIYMWNNFYNQIHSKAVSRVVKYVMLFSFLIPYPKTGTRRRTFSPLNKTEIQFYLKTF